MGLTTNPTSLYKTDVEYKKSDTEGKDSNRIDPNFLFRMKAQDFLLLQPPSMYNLYVLQGLPRQRSTSHQLLQ
jgi:hypothetical protein